MSAHEESAAEPGWRRDLRRGSEFSRFVAALLAAAVAVRFVTVSVKHAVAESSANFAERPVSHAAASTAAVSGRPAPLSAPSARRPDERREPARSVRLMLEVTAGAPRSELYVNGHRVGQTPFLGDTSCKTGEPLRIEVVPPSGAPLTFERTCGGSMIEVSGLPPP